MRSFFYFVPNRQILTLADSAKIGLAYAFEAGIDCTQVQNGLGGQPGIVCAQQDSYVLGKNGYHASQQIWRQIPGSEVWVGHYRDELPGPEDLARAKQLSGWSLELGDGQRWVVPMARSYNEHGSGEDAELRWSVGLPQRLDLAADGRWTRTGISPRYAALWELAEGWLRMRTQTSSPDDHARFDEQGETDGAVCALQANYRLGRVEAALLGLFQVDDMVVEVLDRLIDRPTVEAFTKKKLALMAMAASATPGAGCNSSAGPAAAIPATGPPAPT
jgi:hypothetical protein